MSRLLAYVSEAVDALWRNRARSILTMLGMIIGTSSVIAVLALGNAASSGISGSLDQLGNPGVFVSVDGKQDDPASAQIQFRDVAVVAQDNSDVLDYAFPVWQRTYKINGNNINYDGTVTSDQDYHPDQLTLREGRRIDTSDVLSAAHVTTLSHGMEKHFFGENGISLGQPIRVNGTRFTIVGVYNDYTGIFNNAGGSDYLEIPYTTFAEIAPGPIDSLELYPKPGVSIDDVQAGVVRTLRHLHGPKATYIVQDAVAFELAFEKTIGVVTTGITAIGGVALLVAGIGIMNIMLVSVTERTREIGIRKAIGASASDVILQFLMEAVILSLIGGIVGMLLGIAVALGFYSFVTNLLGPAHIPFAMVITVAVGFSVFVGVVFGTYPAIRAGRLDPIEALRS
jgi:putative ABC transport system permease protein